jgi:nucleoid-associated protein YgaU
MQRVRGVAAISALALLVFGSPLALAAWGRHPTESVRIDDGSLVLVVLTLLGWLAWGTFSVATAAEAVSLATGRPHRIPALAVVQELAGGLLVAAIALLPVSVLIPNSAPPAQSVELQPAIPNPSAAELASAAAPNTTTSDAESSNPQPETTSTYLVLPGDDLWSISERLLGDGRRWRCLAELNPQLADPLSELQPGTRLVIPQAETLTTQAKALPVHTETVTVAKGDTLSRLARDHLGRASKWPTIARANSIIEDPDHIEIGWKLRIPGVPTITQTSATAAPPTSAPSDSSSSSVAPTEPGTAPAPAENVPVESPGQEAANPVTTLTLGTLAAAAVIGTLEVRRALRLRERPIGHRQRPDDEGAARLRTALGATGGPDALEALTAVLRYVGHYCHQHRLELPELATVGVSGQTIRLDWAQPCFEPPPGLTGNLSQWLVSTESVPLADGPCPYPALVSLGTAPDGEVVLVDAERSRLLGVCGPAGRRQDALSAMGVELACAPWSEAVQLVAVGSGAELIRLAGADRVQLATLEQASVTLRRVVERRRFALAKESMSRLRVDPDRSDAVAPFVFCFLDEVPDLLVEEFDQLLAGEPVGVAVILGSNADVEAQWEVTEGPARVEGHLTGRPGGLAAHTIDSATRERLAELFTETEPILAPWWTEVGQDFRSSPIRDEEELDIVRLVEPALHPRLSLIGPVELAGVRGPEPTRSRQQLIELCAWLTENSGATATQMAAALAVAESTRRSNLSRLRAWLGDDPDGQPYLPDAYSGRISLHSAITSDWQQLQLLLKPGINRVSDNTLVAALQLIRGAPLADAAPGQWYWAEELRTDISSALRDAGVELANRCLAEHDLDLARWAASRALAVAPEDELLVCCRLRTEHLAGNQDDAERLVNQLTRQARALGVDLLPETVELCQQVIEGRIRARV